MGWLGLVATALLVGAKARGSDTLVRFPPRQWRGARHAVHPGLILRPDALTQNIQMEAPAALSVWA